MTSPLVILVSTAIVTGAVGSLLIVVAIAVDTWEVITFDTETLQQAESNSPSTIQLTVPSSPSTSYIHLREYADSEWTSYILYNQVCGAWRICDSLSDTARAELPSYNFTFASNKCFHFVSEYDEESSTLPEKGKAIARLQNSAASCFIVSIITLVAAAGVGVIALTQKQVAACMVTGVLYCMTGVFTVFGLTIFHTKHYYQENSCYSLVELSDLACKARKLSIGWAVPLAWVGVVVCTMAAGLWLFVTRAVRVIKAKTML